MPSSRVALLFCACALALAGATVAAAADHPPTAKRAVTDVYHGVSVTEDYRWLEDDASSDVRRWVAEQNATTRAYLDAILQRPAIGARVTELLRTAPIRRYDFRY